MFSARSLRSTLLLTIFLSGLLCPLNASEKKKTPPPAVEQISAPEVVEVGVWPTVIYNLRSEERRVGRVCLYV